MKRAKTRRPGTRGGRRVPTDLPDAAEAALDELLDQRLGAGEEAAVPVARKSDERTVRRPKVPPPGPKSPPKPKRLPSSAQLPDTTPVRRADPQEFSADSITEAEPLDDQQLVEEHALAEIPALRVGIYEQAAALAAVQRALLTCGHVAAAAASGRDGMRPILDAIRADSLDVVLVALPGGEPLIDAALALEPSRPIVIASCDARGVAAVHRAHAAGADLVACAPHDAGSLAPVMLAAARLAHERQAALAARGAEQILRARLEELSDPEPRGLQPFEMFQRVLEIELKRAKRFDYALSVALFAVEIPPPPPPPGIRGILRARAGNALIHTIRDIDIATQIDHERFLVLLPYTDLKGAGGLARRVIEAVAAGDPVIAAGRTFPPRVVGAVAGGSLGQQVSLGKLMKDATRALEQARRDGADLAVQV